MNVLCRSCNCFVWELDPLTRACRMCGYLTNATPDELRDRRRMTEWEALRADRYGHRSATLWEQVHRIDAELARRETVAA